MATKMSIIFDGFEDLAAAVEACSGEKVLYIAVDHALWETQKLIQNNLTTAAAPYASKGGGLKGYATGKMYGTIIKDGGVTWEGSVATIDAGFRIREDGGWHSIFVMYGTPRMAKDTKVFNAIKGTKTKKEIAEKQQEIMSRYITLDQVKG